MKKVPEHHERIIESNIEALRDSLMKPILDMLDDESEIITVNTSINDTEIIKDIEPVPDDDGKVRDVIVEISYLDSEDFQYYSLYDNLNECSLETLISLFNWLKNETK